MVTIRLRLVPDAILSCDSSGSMVPFRSRLVPIDFFCDITGTMVTLWLRLVADNFLSCDSTGTMVAYRV